MKKTGVNFMKKINKKVPLLLSAILISTTISSSMVTLASTGGSNHIPFQTIQKDSVFAEPTSADAYGQPALTHEVKNIMIPNAVDSILKALPAFEYLDQSSIAYGLSFINESNVEFAARVLGGILYDLVPGSTTPSNFRMNSGLEVNLAPYVTSWNPNTGFRNREYFELVMVHEMVHAFTLEALVRGWYGMSEEGTMNQSEQFPTWFSEGVADAVAGEITQSLKLGALDKDSPDSLIGPIFKRLNQPTASAVHGVGYYATLYLGQLVSEEEEFSVANIQKGLNKLFESIISGVSFDDTLKNYTKFKGLEDFEKRLPKEKRACDFVRWVLKERQFDRSNVSATGFGGILTGDFMAKDLLSDTAPDSINPLFKIDSSRTEIINIYPDQVTVLSGGSLNQPGKKPVVTYPDAAPVNPVKLDVPDNFSSSMKNNGEVTVSWKPVENALSYEIELFKKDAKVSDANIENKTEYSFKTNVEDAKEYILKIKAVGNGVKFEESDVFTLKDKGSAPVITGADNVTIKIGAEFDPMQGVTATDAEDGNISNIAVTGSVDTSNAGSYTLTYTATDIDGNVQTAERVVTVRSNEKPVIEGADDVTIKNGEVSGFNPLDGVTVKDDFDTIDVSQIKVTGTVESPEKGTTKDFVLTYEVTDRDGETSKVDRTVTVTNQKPVIEVEQDISFQIGETVDTKKGVRATDTEDGDLTDQITLSGDVDFEKAGRYTVSYNIVDSDGNKAVKYTQISVLAAENSNPASDKAQLQELVDKFLKDLESGRDTSAASSEDWRNYVNVFDQANAALADENISQEDVDSLVEEFIQAEKNLGL